MKLSDDLLEGAAAAAIFLGVKERSVRWMVENGEIPVIRKGRKLFFRKTELERAFQAVA
jgi:excisionase family DNA binding protein